MNLSRRIRGGAIASLAAAAIVLSSSLTASAHVSVKPSSTAAGSSSILDFGIGHGCDGSSTTKITIQIPEGIASAKPVVDAAWTIETVTEPIAETPGTPAAGHGAATERVSEISFTAKEPLPDAYYDTVSVRVGLPEDAVGQTIYFPVVQTCETGETAWIQIPAEGQDGEELDAPAPGLTVTEPVEGGH
jgi:uncharacterized protein YcnI